MNTLDVPISRAQTRDEWLNCILGEADIAVLETETECLCFKIGGGEEKRQGEGGERVEKAAIDQYYCRTKMGKEEWILSR